ncbi:uncharacterized protein LOC132562991 [Ylistrum balloti]|uniref:uncharacterized protein LOC132562991 n=1 Tax=Ylistrum balloti TaxID=509963 RepID=UPI002905A60A|nr:uncharacterized protein LOC132562991 [Ylistrum balloti]
MADTALPECSLITDLPETNASHPTPDIVFSTEQRIVGTTVDVTCPEGYNVIGQDTITCLISGQWDADALPHCSDVVYGIPDSTKIYLGVFAICGALCLIVFTVVLTKIICFKDKTKYSNNNFLGRSTESVSSMQYFPEEKGYRAATQPEVIIDDPQSSTPPPDIDTIATYVNQSYLVDEQERWRQRLSSYDSSFDGDFDLQWHHIQPEVPQDNSRKWSNHSIPGVDTYDYDQYGGMPVIGEGEHIGDDRTPF